MKDMSIAINTRHLVTNKMDGIGWFTYQTIQRIVTQHPGIHFYFLFDRNFNPEFIFSDNITPIIISPPARHPLLIYYWNEWAVPNLLNKLHPVVYLSFDGLISKRAKYKQYAVVHDLNFLVFPEYLPYSVRKLYNHFLIKNIRCADRIATVSQFSKAEIVKYLNYPENKIDVVYNAPNIKLNQETNGFDEKQLKEKFTQGKDYFIYVGSIHARKNIDGMIKAFIEYKNKTNVDDKFIIVGRFYWGRKEIMKLVNDSKYTNDIIFTGRLDDYITASLIKSAKALVLVSHYEGFGVPVIEAMQLGTPVITSHTTSLNEIAGSAALKVNPQSIQEITAAMETIHVDKNLVNSLIRKGKEHCQKYNWDANAHNLWKGIEQLIYE